MVCNEWCGRALCKAAAAQPARIRAAAPSGGSVYRGHTKRSRGPAGDNPRRSSFRRLCVLRLPRKEKPRPSRRQSAPQVFQETLCTASATQRGAVAQPATIRAAAPSGGSVYCVCHAWFDSPLVQGASRLRYTDKAQVAATGLTDRAILANRQPQEKKIKSQRPGHTGRKALATKKKYCVCHAKRSRGPAGDNPRRSSFTRLLRKEEPRPSRRQSALQLQQEALCTAPATQQVAAAQPATIRAAAPSRGSVNCVCHAKRSRGPAGDNPRRSSFRRLCVLCLPRKEEPRPSRRQSPPQLLQEALCTAPATQEVAAATCVR